MSDLVSRDDKQNSGEQVERSLLEGVLHYLSILLRYKYLIIGATAIAAVGILLFSIVSVLLPPDRSPLPNKYKAIATLLVQEAGEGSALTAMIASLGLGSEGLSSTSTLVYGEIAVRVIQSRSFIDRLVEDFDIIEKYGIVSSVKSSSRRVILDNMDLNYDRNTALLTVGFEHIDPVFAKDIVNGTVKRLNEWFAEWGGTSKIRQKNLLEQKLGEVSRDISELESRILEFQKKHGVLTVQEFATLQSTQLAELRSRLYLKEMEIKTYSEFSRIEDPALARLRSERTNLLDLIRKIEQGSGDIDSLMPARRDLPELALEFARLTMNLQIQTRIYESLSQQYEIAKLNMESEPLFQVLELAEVPDEKSSPSRISLCLLTTIGAFVVSIISAFIIHAIKKIDIDGEKLKVLTGKI